jgi:hypothetical protein
MPKRIEHYLENLGHRVQKMQITDDDLDNYLVVEKDGEISLYPKAVGPVRPLFLLLKSFSLNFIFFFLFSASKGLNHCECP